MNKFMHRLIVHGGKRGGSYDKSVAARTRKREKQRLHIESTEYECPDWESNHRGGKVLGWGAREFGDNLNPLINWLEAQVGRKWDDVYSEIRRTYRLTSNQSVHVLNHIIRDDRVPRTFRGRDGKIYNVQVWPWRSFSIGSEDGFVQIYDGDLYICPDDGTVKRMDGQPRKRNLRESDPDRDREVTWEGYRYRCHGGIWYRRSVGTEIVTVEETYRVPSGSYDTARRATREVTKEVIVLGVERQINKQEKRDLLRALGEVA